MRTKILCPICRKPAIRLKEVWKNHYILFDTDEKGLWLGNDGYLEPGEPYCVRAKCKCGHRWTLRGITQIEDLINEKCKEKS
jgi:hypothetical protein